LPLFANVDYNFSHLRVFELYGLFVLTVSSGFREMTTIISCTIDHPSHLSIRSCANGFSELSAN